MTERLTDETRWETIERNLVEVLTEIEAQEDVGHVFSPDVLSFSDTIAQVREWIEAVHEPGLAYESIIAMLERYPFKISGSAAVKLVEVALLMRFETERDEDSHFDTR